MIRRMGKGDLDAVAAIWLDANREAHDFIPAAYWLGHFAEVRTALARAEVWVFETRRGPKFQASSDFWETTSPASSSGGRPGPAAWAGSCWTT